MSDDIDSFGRVRSRILTPWVVVASVLVFGLVVAVFRARIASAWTAGAFIACCALVVVLVRAAVRRSRGEERGRSVWLTISSLVFAAGAVSIGMFWLFVFVVTGPPATDATLIRTFERDTGFAFPAEAMRIETYASRSDPFGDWSGALAFDVPLQTIEGYLDLPSQIWGESVDSRILEAPGPLWRGEGYRSDFLIPKGSVLVRSNFGRDVDRRLALDPVGARVYFYRFAY